MKICPKNDLRNKIFFNNLILIFLFFSILAFATSLIIQLSDKQVKDFSKIYGQKEFLYGPINVTNKTKIYKVEAQFRGKNSGIYLNGEVLDKNKETVYEFGKDFWHESGYDYEGYWSESDSILKAYLTFKDYGKYYINFSSDKPLDQLFIRVSTVKKSYIPHYALGIILLFLSSIFFYTVNYHYINEKFVKRFEW